MHANGALLDKLFGALRRHDHEAMASCYHPAAHFRDIAFDLYPRERIHDMWRMICSGDIQAEFEIIDADDRGGRVRLGETYTFHTSKRPPDDKVTVGNAIVSRFLFNDGLILRQDDDCDAKEWARQAMAKNNPVVRFLAGRIRLLRSLVAKAKLAKFVKNERA